jgi:hypothetical protein
VVEPIVSVVRLASSSPPSPPLVDIATMLSQAPARTVAEARGRRSPAALAEHRQDRRLGLLGRLDPLGHVVGLTRGLLGRPELGRRRQGAEARTGGYLWHEFGTRCSFSPGA